MATKSSTEERAIALLGAGLGPESVAAAVGVSVSRISQLLSDPEFAASVTEIRFETLNKHNARDNKYDALEDKVLDSLEKALPFLVMDPIKLTGVLRVLNAATRRGQSAPESIINQKTVVNITLPRVIQNNFITNTHNQVIKAGPQDLVTLQSSAMSTMLETSLARNRNESAPLVIENSPTGALHDETPIPTGTGSNSSNLSRTAETTLSE